MVYPWCPLSEIMSVKKTNMKRERGEDRDDESGPQIVLAGGRNQGTKVVRRPRTGNDSYEVRKLVSLKGDDGVPYICLQGIANTMFYSEARPFMDLLRLRQAAHETPNVVFISEVILRKDYMVVYMPLSMLSYFLQIASLLPVLTSN